MAPTALSARFAIAGSSSSAFPQKQCSPRAGPSTQRPRAAPLVVEAKLIAAISNVVSKFQRREVGKPQNSPAPPPLFADLDGDDLRVRSVFISDVHLGTRGCQADVLLDFLKTVKTEHLYLVGDILDCWEIEEKRIHWPQAHSDVLQKLLRKARKGTKITYTPGNHDEACRTYLREWPTIDLGDNITIVEEAVHTMLDGRRFLILHGDRCDNLVHLRSDLSYAAKSAMYRVYQAFNRGIKLVRRAAGLPYWSLAAAVNSNAKFAQRMIDEYERAVALEAKALGYDGVVCGHIHHAGMKEIEGITYCNDGDWVDSCSALVEHLDGRLEIVRWLEMAPAGANGGSRGARAIGKKSARKLAKTRGDAAIATSR